MHGIFRHRTLLLVIPTILLFAVPALADGTGKKTLEFNRDIRHILSENCFTCHGFDINKRQANLRLDNPEGAYAKQASGKRAIVPGDIKNSEILKRITMSGPLHMPPLKSGKTLTAPQVAALKQWVAQGAKYEPHWAFVSPKRPSPPQVKNRVWPRTPIDLFLLSRMEKGGLKPSPEADRRTLIRRLSFDLIGLPPTPAEIKQFVEDRRPDAYERVVDRLLASPHYGERLALAWLDVARYADTHGYHIDSQRDMWRWREWVIEAFNSNMPYDRFVVEQLAGDLLPNATQNQKLATGFNRNHPINFEGGAIPEEYAAAYIFDRIDTTATAFMGLTMRCAQCHDHKYDPLTNKDFYRFYAFFNTVPEQGLDGQAGNAMPYMKAPLPGQMDQLEAYKKRSGEIEAALGTRKTESQTALAAWEKDALKTLANSSTASLGLAAHFQMEEADGNLIRDSIDTKRVGTIQGKVSRENGKSGKALAFDGTNYVDIGTQIGFERTDKVSYGAWINPSSRDAMTVISRMDDAADVRGWDIYLGDGRVFAHLINKWDSNAIRVNTKMQVETGKWTHVFVTYDGSSKANGVRIYINGEPAELDRTHDSLTGSIVTPKPAHIGRRNASTPFRGLIDDARFYKRELSEAEVANLANLEAVRQILVTAPAKRTEEQKDALTRYYLENYDSTYRTLNVELAETRKKQSELDKAIPTTMVMQEMEKPRDTFMLVRGQYEQKGEKVTAGVPAALPSLPAGTKADRLALARWLVAPSHPLTARVAVNRLWQMLFGQGIVRTPENFGTQGELPTHPELLDWLATEYPRIGWDTKAMLRLLVTSAAYRQTSKTTRQAQEQDPENRLLSRAPRFRLQGELIRDQALAVSGLLVDKLGGPSVHPYHPAGLWEEMAFGGDFSAQRYVQDHGDSLYRRGMYTFWKRTCPPPSLQTFDAPEREFCMVRRSVTNTPLQALVLMNDTTYVEAARKFAERLMTETVPSPNARIAHAYRLALSRDPSAQEMQIVMGLFNQQMSLFRKNKSRAEKLLNVGEMPRNKSLDPIELAGWTAVCSTLLNLDETITRN